MANIQPTEWQRVEDLLDQVWELEPTAQRRLIDQVRSTDPGLAQRLVAILTADDSDGFLDTPAMEHAGELLGAETPGTDPRIGVELRERYRIEKGLARGGMGVVYLARDLRLKKTVAVKFIYPGHLADSDAVRRFEDEVRSASRVDHSSVARVLDTGEHESARYLVMEYVDGHPLRHSSERDLHEIVDLAIQIAKGLTAIHGEGVIHRDLKPSNILITPDGFAKVVDFGVATRGHDPQSIDADGSTRTGSLTLTRPGRIVGTPAYMSPEQLRAEKLDPRSDLFSLGVVLYELITGNHPFLADSFDATVAAIKDGAPEGDDSAAKLDVAGPLKPIVLGLLEKRATERPPDAEQLVTTLQAARRNLDLRPAPRRRLPAAMWWAAALMLALMSAVVWQLWPEALPERPFVAVLPFEDRTGEAEGPLTARMFADLLSADLGESSRLRVMEPGRVLDLESTTARAGIALFSSHSPAEYVVSGKLYRDGDVYEATLELRRTHDGSPARAARVTAGGTAALVDLAKVSILTSLFPEAKPDDESDPEAAALTSRSAEARRLEYRARVALRELRLVEAVADLERATQIDAQFLAARIRLADALDRSGYAARAREAADLALRLIDAQLVSATRRRELDVRATHAHVTGQTEAEIQYRREAVAERPGEPEPLFDLARAMNRRGASAAEALAIVKIGLELDPDDPRGHLLRARVLGALKRFDDGDGALDRSQQIFTELDNPAGLAATQFARGVLLNLEHRIEEAGAHFRSAQELYTRAGLAALAARAGKARGDTELRAGNLAVAEVHYRDALEVARTHGNYVSIVNATDSLGAGLYSRGKFKRAEQLLREAIAEARRLDHPRLILTPVLNLSDLLTTTGRASEARTLAREGLELARDVGNTRAETKALQAIATSDLGDGRLSDARVGYEHVVALQRGETGRKLYLSNALLGLAEINDWQGDLSAAIATVDEAIALARESKRPHSLCWGLLTRGSIRAQLGLFEEARADLDEAWAIGTEKKLPYRRRIEVIRSRSALMEGRYDDAIAAIERARASEVGTQVAADMAELVACEMAVVRRDWTAGGRACRAAVEANALPEADRIAAQGYEAATRAGNGGGDEALRDATAALAAAERLELRLVQVRLGGALASFADDSATTVGSEALARYVAGAPAEWRDRLWARPDLQGPIEALEGAIVRDGES
ncbi:MAG: protein kinase [bacterium]|nr:protein kinase [bacterium]